MHIHPTDGIICFGNFISTWSICNNWNRESWFTSIIFHFSFSYTNYLLDNSISIDGYRYLRFIGLYAAVSVVINILPLISTNMYYAIKCPIGTTNKNDNINSCQSFFHFLMEWNFKFLPYSIGNIFSLYAFLYNILNQICYLPAISPILIFR